MKKRIQKLTMGTLTFALFTSFSGGHAAGGPVNASFRECTTPSILTSEQRRAALLKAYPSIVEGGRPENPKILCPFHRLLERTGMYDDNRNFGNGIRVAIRRITQLASDFGCSKLSCGTVASAVSAGQLTQGTTSWGRVNVEALHSAIGIAHDCGLTFEKGGQEVSERVRDRTLNELKTLTDSKGRLGLDDLRRVQMNRCNEQGVKPSSAGLLEGELIYTFLGGNDRGSILYDDVVRFLHAQLPLTIGEPGSARN